MRQTPALLAVAVAVACPARAAVSESAVQARLGSLFAGSAPIFGAFELPVRVPAAQGRAVANRAQQAPLIPRSYWEKAAAPHPQHLAWLQNRIPGLKADMVREISYADVSEVIDEAARRGYSTLDIFTDDGLRGDVAYYLPAATLKRLFGSFDLATALVASGKTVDGDAFTMDGLVMGRGQLHVLFNMGPFKFDHPTDGNRYEVASRIVQTIEGPGRLAVSGMSVKHWPVWPRIQRLIKLGPGRMRVETNYGSQDQDDRAVRRR